ncbi:MAG: hypothetical protein PHE17_19885, partial [Thiothrix sp.]|uniref:hypothetical protein n=1 Tax=Thiothrix sp. TaxID=1032 RepID=UPI00260E3AD1
MIRKTTLVLTLMASTSVHSFAASITLDHYGTFDNITIAGRIEPGDYQKFTQIAQSLKGPVRVSLASLGGSFDDGINIGEVIHASRWDTEVIDGWDCVSSCANIWLAGRHRTITGQSQVAFHAPYALEDPQHADGAASAMFGVYLAHLGYSYGDVTKLMGHSPKEYRSFFA